MHCLQNMAWLEPVCGGSSSTSNNSACGVDGGDAAREVMFGCTAGWQAGAQLCLTDAGGRTLNCACSWLNEDAR